jgi:hypothetical protein
MRRRIRRRVEEMVQIMITTKTTGLSLIPRSEERVKPTSHTDEIEGWG